MKPLIRNTVDTPKGWGRELEIANNDRYCGKVLEFNPLSKCSMHFHGKKHETWYVLRGTLSLRWIEGVNGEEQERMIYEGDVIEIPPLMPHRLQACASGAAVLEVSTPHEDSDSYRVSPGDSQRFSKYSDEKKSSH